MIETAVLISIKPKWVRLILSGKKTIEVRKTVPKLTPPFTCYIYESGTGCVVGEFICTGFTNVRMLSQIIPDEDGDGYTRVYQTDYDALKKACLSPLEAAKYGNRLDTIGLHISSVKEYETPLPVTAFMARCDYDGPCALCKHAELDPVDECLTCQNIVTKPPQSWRYVQKRVE